MSDKETFQGMPVRDCWEDFERDFRIYGTGVLRMSEPDNAMIERIASVAIRLSEGMCVVPRPGRHHDCIHALAKWGVQIGRDDQGFMTDAGRWVDRKEAWRIAEAAGQIVHDVGTTGVLYSENLW